VKLLFITSTRIGDAVLSTGILNHLIETYPGARFTIACGPLATSLFSAIPRLDRVIPMKKKSAGLHWLKLWSEVVDETWDLVVDLRRSLLSYCLRCKSRLVLGPIDNSCHRLRLLARLFSLDPPPAPYLWLEARHRAAAARLIPDDLPVLGVGPASARPEKTWPHEKFIAVIKAATKSNASIAGGRVALFGAEEDKSIMERIAKALPQAKPILICGHPDLLTIQACLGRCTAFIGNDSGLTHMAAAAGRPTIAIFGPTEPELYAPWGDHVLVVSAPNGDLSALAGDKVINALCDVASGSLRQSFD